MGRGLGWRHRRRRRLTRQRWLACVSAALLLLAGAQLWLHAKYVTLAPGWARPASTLVQVRGARGGENLLYVVVAARRANLIDYVRSWFDAAIEVRPKEDQLAGEQGWTEYARRMQEMMDESQAVAAAVALRSLDYRVDLDAFAHGGGPVPLDFRERGIVGASAGLMMALELFVQLTGEEWVARRLIAGTGVLRADGTVHPVDGVRQKIATSLAAGAEVFLIPRENLDEARGMASDIRLVPVETFEEAVAALRRLSAEDDSTF